MGGARQDLGAKAASSSTAPFMAPAVRPPHPQTMVNMQDCPGVWAPGPREVAPLGGGVADCGRTGQWKGCSPWHRAGGRHATAQRNPTKWEVNFHGSISPSPRVSVEEVPLGLVMIPVC